MPYHVSDVILFVEINGIEICGLFLMSSGMISHPRTQHGATKLFHFPTRASSPDAIGLPEIPFILSGIMNFAPFMNAVSVPNEIFP